NVIPDATGLTVTASAVFNLGGFNETIGALAGTGSVTLGGGTLTSGFGGASSSFSGSITGAGNLVKTGGGTFTFSGTGTYVGSTTVSQGTFKLDPNPALAGVVAHYTFD